ncbi:MAG: hypothetical protein AAGE52_08005 [Myxococcota bacterium]
MKSIGDLASGEEAIVRGSVQSFQGPQRSPIGGHECVYWDTRPRVGAEPEQRSGTPFWVVDATGKVLVLPREVLVRGPQAREQAVVEAAAGDIAAVSHRIRAIKQELRESPDGDLRRERRRLAKLATVLCAIRAHARGNVHRGGTLEGQQRFIDANLHLVQDGDGEKTIRLMMSRFEVLLCDGEKVRVSGRFAVEPMPAGIEGAQGYRDRATCIVVRSGATQATVESERVPAPAWVRHTPKQSAGEGSNSDAENDALPPPHRDPIVRATAVLTALAVALYYWLA